MPVRSARRSSSLAPPNAGQMLAWSGRPDLNRRPPAPKAGALPGCATPRHETALFILKHFPTLLLIRVVIFGLTVPKLCQILLLNRSCARFQRHLVGLAVHFLQ